MKTQRWLLGLTFVNLVLLIVSFSRLNAANADSGAAMLRGRGLEIVDDRGRVRASISVLPADPHVKMPDGSTGYPETVLLRLITTQGRPNVKLETNEKGAGLLIAGESDPAYVQVLAHGTATSIRLGNKDGREQVIKP